MCAKGEEARRAPGFSSPSRVCEETSSVVQTRERISLLARPRRLRQVYIVERRPVSPGAHCTPSPRLVAVVGDRCEASSVLERTSSLR